jgi:uncharacterized protein YfaS (alpha-2-macroglobulin family)
MNAKQRFATVAMLTLFLPGSQKAMPQPNAARQVIVIVRTMSLPRRAVEGALVYILAANGQRLASATTDSTGRVALRGVKGKNHPVYVLVEATNCYISGVRWVPGLEEYYILVGGMAAQ